MVRFFQEFKEFAIKGNVLDLAVGIIIGGAFNSIVSSLVNDIMMPPIGLVLKKVNFTNLFITLGDKNYSSLAEAKNAGAPTINYGIFINNIISFTITAGAVFLLVRAINKIQRIQQANPQSHPTPTTKTCPFCFSTIPVRAVKCPNCTADIRTDAFGSDRKHSM